MQQKNLVLIIVICCFADLTMAQLPRQKIIKMDKYVPVLISKDSVFFQQIDSLIFNSVCSDFISSAKPKIFTVECTKNENNYALKFHMMCQMHFHNKLELQGCFEYRDYLFLWYGKLPRSLWSISTRKKKLTYLKGEPFEVPVIICDWDEFAFDYIDGKLILIWQSCL